MIESITDSDCQFYKISEADLKSNLHNGSNLNTGGCFVRIMFETNIIETNQVK